MSARICQGQLIFSNPRLGNPYSLLERRHFIVGQRICLGDDGNQIDLGVKATHDLDVEWLQRVASRLDEVHASMNSVIHDVHSVDFVLSFQVGIESLFDVLHNWSPRVVIVDEVSKAWRINDGQAQANQIFFDICTD